ncbi:hypothetical protein [Streptomyces syringium]|uniref:hypothetical protein n=1 Tax=Streptomyces syringium TaxID=76729 RepID=UPI00341605A8
MTVTDPEPERHITEQHNHGPGAFVAGDNHGDIRIEAVDAKTKSLLSKMSKDSPALARLLKKALDDGAISADTASSLAWAARSINEDVAHTLWQAARSINEDVAGQMSHAAETFDKASSQLDFGELNKIVTRFEDAVSSQGHKDLSSLVTRLEGSLSSLDQLARDVDRLQNRDRPLGRIEEIGIALNGVANRIEATVTPPPPEILPDHRGRAVAFFWGLGIGAAVISYLLNR